MDEAAPVGELFYKLYEDFYWHYNLNRNGRQDTANSPADSEHIDEENRTVWGLNLAEPSGPRAADVQHHREQILYTVVSDAIRNRGQVMNALRGDWENKNKCASDALRNLSNAWRDEFALTYPHESEYKHRSRTAEWRMIKCYYAIYKSASAIRNTKHTSSRRHNEALDQHRQEFLAKRDLQCLYTYPFNFNPDHQKFFDYQPPYPVSEYDYDFERSRKEEVADDFSDESQERMGEVFTRAEIAIPTELDDNPDTFHQVMKGLREWANYKRGGIMARLYGEGYGKAIDRSLRLLAYSALTTAEVMVISSFGFDRFQEVFSKYKTACEQGFANSHRLIKERYKVYEQALSGF